MSEGPIKREREATTVPRIAIAEKDRVCQRDIRLGVPVRALCGRKKSQLSEHSFAVTCPDCKAAARADSESDDSEQPT